MGWELPQQERRDHADQRQGDAPLVLGEGGWMAGGSGPWGMGGRLIAGDVVWVVGVGATIMYLLFILRGIAIIIENVKCHTPRRAFVVTWCACRGVFACSPRGHSESSSSRFPTSSMSAGSSPSSSSRSQLFTL